MQIYPEFNLKEIKSWEELVLKLGDCDAKTKGDVFEYIVKRYLTFDPVYKTKLKNVWLLSEIPSSVAEILELPQNDMGIDLIAETHSGEYWAIQCKYHGDTTRSLTWREVSTFTGLAFGLCKNISYGLICTTGERYAGLLNERENIGLCSAEIWRGLRGDFFEYITGSFNKNLLTPLIPRAHQKSAIEKSGAYFKANNRGKIIMPCGTGKSLTSFWVQQMLDSRSTLVVVPSISLMRQTLRVWLREISALNESEDVEWLCVCSDATVSKREVDEVVLSPQDLGVPTTSDSHSIANWMNRTKNAKKRIVFTTYQSGKKIAEGASLANVHFMFGVFDEAHKTVGHKDTLFSYLLYDENIHIEKRLFMTATERRYIGESSQIASMDNPSIYGETIELLTFKKALEQIPKIVADYRVLTLFITRAEVAQLILDKKYVKMLGSDIDEVEAETLAALIALKKAAKKYPISHTISFHSSIARAKTFKILADEYTRLVPEDGTLKVLHTSGKVPSSVRQHTLDEFVETEKSLITNARCLTEGIDIPSVNCVLFVDPKKSRVDIVQALGRALRPLQGKEYGYIVIPVLVENLDDVDTAFTDSNEFSNLIITLRALASNDERIIDYFRDRSTQTANGNSHSNESIINIQASTQIDIRDFSSAIELRCWENIIKLSYGEFDKAKKFVHGINLHNELEWQYYCDGWLHNIESKPINIPNNPAEVYSTSWKSWEDWLGRNPVGVQYLKFDMARKMVHELELGTQKEWEYFFDKNKLKNIPLHPNIIYYREWKGWDDWLGDEQNAENYLEYDEARNIALSLDKKYKRSSASWPEYVIDHPSLRLPKHPETVYKERWLGWLDWYFDFSDNLKSYHLNPMDRSNSSYIEFLEQRIFARQIGATGKNQWLRYCNNELKGYSPKPDYIFDEPNIVWPAYWKNWDDWLWDEKYMKFQHARKFVRTLNLKTRSRWMQYCEGTLKGYAPKPPSIPVVPKQAYEKDWLGWRDWLGVKSEETYPNHVLPLQKSNQYLPFNLARVVSRKLNLTSNIEWAQYCQTSKKPEYIPTRPEIVYEKEWVSWSDWLRG